MSGHDKRQRRLERLAGVVQRKLDHEVAGLAQAQQAQRQAEEGLAQAKQRLQDAVTGASQKLSQGLEAAQWQAEHQWQDSLRARVQSAKNLVESCAHEVAEARTRVLIAHEDLQKMNALLKRLELSNKAELARQERRAEDDTYAVLASVGSRNDGP